MNKPFLFAAAVIILLTTLTYPQAHARGGSDGGGGDRCEERFKAVAFDIQQWIIGGGAAGLDFSKLQKPVTLAAYTSAMLPILQSYHIECVSPGDMNFPVEFSNTSKECVSLKDENGAKFIRCDRAKIYSNSPNPEDDPSLYRIVHHEFATQAGLEGPNGGDSNYGLDDQLDGFLEQRVVHRLAIKATRTAGFNDQVQQCLEKLAKYAEKGEPSSDTTFNYKFTDLKYGQVEVERAGIFQRLEIFLGSSPDRLKTYILPVEARRGNKIYRGQLRTLAFIVHRTDGDYVKCTTNTEWWEGSNGGDGFHPYFQSYYLDDSEDETDRQRLRNREHTPISEEVPYRRSPSLP